jgi:hypothetical protein
VEHSPDDEGIMGLYLSKELPKQAGRVLEKCVRKIAPEIMTWSQYAGKCSSHSPWGLAGCLLVLAHHLHVAVGIAGTGPAARPGTLKRSYVANAGEVCMHITANTSSAMHLHAITHSLEHRHTESSTHDGAQNLHGPNAMG